MNQRGAILEVKGLGKDYQGQPLLRRVDFSLASGEILCLLGPSGAGKTTLLRLLAGLETPDRGAIRCNGRELRDLPPHRRNFGMMFQDYALFPHQTVGENVAFGLEMQGWPKDEKARRVEEMLALVGLADLARRSVADLSGGERQRVALARSLAPGPPLLLLDEPLGSLDRALRDRLAGEIRAILKNLAVTAVFVTHDQSEAFTVADQVAILQQGMLQQFASPERLYRRPANPLVAAFLGFANLVPCRVAIDGDCHSPLGIVKYTGNSSLSPGNATLLLRPEGARLADGSRQDRTALQLAGVVTARHFQGSSYRLSLSSAGEQLTFDLPINPPPPEIGMTVRLLVDGEALVVLR